ncbi:MAG: four helix bundle protein [Deltaproteobacteria bacterium]|nr:four helix bundle protein [Deltaproteobacteria bacterium]
MTTDILERSVAYPLRIIKLYRELQKDEIGRIIGRQLLRSGTSIGANIHEAQGGQSKADFVAKMSIAHKETLESVYWLRLIREADLVPSGRIDDLADETEQLSKALASILYECETEHQAMISLFSHF